MVRARQMRFLLLILTAMLGVWAGSASAREVEVLFLQTTDIHAHLYESSELETGGGWLRLASVIDQKRSTFGPDRTLLIDCGDTCQGSLEAIVSQGEVAPRLLKHLTYDVWVPGNHELDFGVRRLTELCEMAGDMVLCGNLTLERDDRTIEYPAWRTFVRSGARIAVIGANASYLGNWLWGKKMKGYEVEPAFRMLSRIMPAILRTQPDMIVLAIHQGWLEAEARGVNEINAIVRRFPEIDLILGGHTHIMRPGAKLGPKTWYVQSGKHAGHLAVVRARIDIERHTVLDVHSALVPAGPELPVDKAAEAAVEDIVDMARKSAEVVVGRAGSFVSAEGWPGEDCGTSELLCEAIAAATGADVVLHGRLSHAGLRPGPVTEQDLVRLIPYENSLALAELTLEELRDVVQEQWDKRESYAYNGIWGLNASVQRDGTVEDLSCPAAPKKERVLVALNSYATASAGGRFPRLKAILNGPNTKLRDTGINSRDALRRFFETESPVKIVVRRWLCRESAGK